MTSTGPFLLVGSSKIQFFTGIWYLFCWRPLRPAYVTFLKNGCKYQNVITSGIDRTHDIYEIINFDTCQNQITLPISIRDTLYTFDNFLICIKSLNIQNLPKNKTMLSRRSYFQGNLLWISSFYPFMQPFYYYNKIGIFCKKWKLIMRIHYNPSSYKLLPCR